MAPAHHKKRPPAIRDTHIDTWQIAAAPAPAPHDSAAEEAAEHDAAAAAADGAAPAALQAGAGLSRATSLTLAADAAADASARAAQPLPHLAQLQHLHSTATSYHSALDEEGAPLDAEVDAFTTKLNVRAAGGLGLAKEACSGAGDLLSVAVRACARRRAAPAAAAASRGLCAIRPTTLLLLLPHILPRRAWCTR